MPALTLDRLLASIGFGSRKEARALVRMGLVELDGEVLDDPFMEFASRPESIMVNGEDVPTVEKLYVMLHKPVDVECSHSLPWESRRWEGLMRIRKAFCS